MSLHLRAELSCGFSAVAWGDSCASVCFLQHCLSWGEGSKNFKLLVNVEMYWDLGLHSSKGDLHLCKEKS